jgi:hypothetical protein
VTNIEIPQWMLVKDFVTELPAKALKERFGVPRAMVDWMRHNANDAFRFAMIHGPDTVGDDPIPVGCRLIGGESDLTLFRINFGF